MPGEAGDLNWRISAKRSAGGLSALCGCESNGRSRIVIDNHDVGAVGATRRHHSDLLVQGTVARTRGDTWATQPLVDSADRGDGPESVQHGLRDADMDLAAATDQAISPSLRQCELAVQDLIAIGSAEEKPGQNDRPLVDSADKGDGPESVQHGLRDADMDSAAFYGTSTRRLAAPLARSTFSLICRPADFQAAQTTTRRR